MSSISADGRFVAMIIGAPDLDPADTNGWSDTYIHDRLTGATAFVSVGPDGEQASFGTSHVSISGDGRYVTFVNWGTGLMPDDENGSVLDVVLRDCHTGEMSIVSRNDDGEQNNATVWAPSISADGRTVVFESRATNLHPDETDNDPDIFLRDLDAEITLLLSPGPGGPFGESIGESRDPEVNADGTVAVYESDAINLWPGDGNGRTDAFSYDRGATADPPTLGDLDGDTFVTFGDLVLLLGAWGACPATCPAHLDASGTVDFADLLVLLSNWG